MATAAYRAVILCRYCARTLDIWVSKDVHELAHCVLYTINYFIEFDLSNSGVTRVNG